MLDSMSSSGIRDCLDMAAGCLAQAFPEGHPGLSALNALHARLDQGRLQIAILGQFKRGKSTFINALLRGPFLPAAVVPATAIPTFIAWGSTPQIRVMFQDDRPVEEISRPDSGTICEQLRQWVTEECNPLNCRRVRRVELFVPAEVLRSGIVLIDTPGVGSTLRHNTDAALDALPECDTALFVVSADPPITEAEMAYLGTAQSHVVRLYFVLNKIDYLTDHERQEAIDFLHSVLGRFLVPGVHPAIFPISARHALAASMSADPGAFEASGLPNLERQVLAPLIAERRVALQEAVRVKAGSLLEHALADARLKIRALELPLEDLEQRADALHRVLDGVGMERRVAQDTLQGDRQRASAEVEDQAATLRQEAQKFALGIVAQEMESHNGTIDRPAIQRRIDQLLPPYFETKLAQVAAVLCHSLEATLSRHQARLGALVGLIRKSTADLFGIDLPQQQAPEPFRLRSEPYWVTQKIVHPLIPSPTSLLRRLLPHALRRRYQRHELEEELVDLIQRNVENLRWATHRSLEETFRQFASQLDNGFADTLAVTEGSIRQVIERRRFAADDALEDLRFLRAVETRMQHVIAGLNTADISSA